MAGGAGGDDAEGDAGLGEGSQRSAPSNGRTAGTGAAQQRHEEDTPGLRASDGQFGRSSIPLNNNQPDAATEPAYTAQQQQPLNPNGCIGVIPSPNASHTHRSNAVDGVGEEHVRTQGEAAQAAEAAEATGNVGADLDALEVPMMWLEPQAVSFAVEEEDYD